MLVIGQMQLHEDSMQACEARVRYDVKQESWTLEGFFQVDVLAQMRFARDRRSTESDGGTQGRQCLMPSRNDFQCSHLVHVLT